MRFVRPFREVGELNSVERLKLARHPLDVAQAVREVYTREGVDAIYAVPGEAERLKWVGIYPQRQGGDAFMLRIKVPAGKLTAAQARRIGEVVDEVAAGPSPHPQWGDRYCDITTRQDIQLHWVQIAEVPSIWDRLEEVGVTSLQACGDSARNVLCCPVAGVDAEEAFDASPVAVAISDFFTGHREYANLPRKFKLSITGCLDDCAQSEINDIGLRPAERDGELGFHLLVGGGLSDGPRMASDMDVFVGIDDALEVCRAIAQLFGELGNRENRGLARMRYLVQELGAEGFRRELEARSAVPLRTAGKDLTRRYRGDHVGIHPQRDGTSYVGCSVPVGRISGADLVEVARLAEEYGSGEVRLATDQNFILLGVAPDRIDALLAEELLQRFSPFPGPFTRGVVACTGSEFCRFAVVETKARALSWAQELDERFAAAFGGPAGTRERRDDTIVRLHFSGCSASCAQPQIADVGFRGETAHRGDEIVEAVDIGVGGSLGDDAAFANWVAGALPVDEVPDALARLVGRFASGRRDGERFHEFVRRIGDEDARATLVGEVAP